MASPLKLDVQCIFMQLQSWQWHGNSSNNVAHQSKDLINMRERHICLKIIFHLHVSWTKPPRWRLKNMIFITFISKFSSVLHNNNHPIVAYLSNMIYNMIRCFITLSLISKVSLLCQKNLHKGKRPLWIRFEVCFQETFCWSWAANCFYSFYNFYSFYCF